MTRWVAFLRAINVGGHTVTMSRLRDLFGDLGLAGVETFIASGNVVFNARTTVAAPLERKIERQLHQALGYEVKTFLRTGEEVAAISAHAAFTRPQLRTAVSLNVGFLEAPLTAPGVRSLRSLRTEFDEFTVHGRELYWLSRRGQGKSTFSNVVFERTVGARITFRGLKTVSRLVAKYGFAAEA